MTSVEPVSISVLATDSEMRFCAMVFQITDGHWVVFHSEQLYALGVSIIFPLQFGLGQSPMTVWFGALAGEDVVRSEIILAVNALISVINWLRSYVLFAIEFSFCSHSPVNSGEVNSA